ncbi:hypothetical protein K474DRAFT_1663733 [Panus rudis PR-1116 ss-1]|nr:hypothetical protein K474DRAFT_1663733 [Panus rudis PR-1116 ss-1]
MASPEQSVANPPSTQEHNNSPSTDDNPLVVIPVTPKRIRPRSNSASSQVAPTYVWGFLIPREFTSRLVRQFFEMAGDMFTREQVDEFAEDEILLDRAAREARAYLHKRIPGLPAPFPVNMTILVEDDHILPLADNGCKGAMKAMIPLTSIEALRKEMGLDKDALPNWYKVEVYS